MTGTELELKTLLLEKKRQGRHLGRAELNRLCRSIWRKRRALKREKHLTKIKEGAEMGKPPRKQSKHFNWSSIAKQENPETVLTDFFQDLYSIFVDLGDIAQSERNPLDLAMDKLANGLCGWNADLNEETGESPEQGSDHSGWFESIARGMSGKVNEIVDYDVLGLELSRGMAVLFDSNGTESCVRISQVTPSTAIRQCTDGVCAENSR